MPKRASSTVRYDSKRRRTTPYRRRPRHTGATIPRVRPYGHNIVNRRGVAIRSKSLILNTSAGEGTSETYEFHAGDVLDHAVLGNVYDHYRIKKASVTFWIEESGSVVPAERIDWDKYNITMVCKTDYDDNSPRHIPLLILDPQATHFNIVKDKKYYWSLMPKPALNIFNGSPTSDGHGIASNRIWLDCANSAIPHYGFKWAINGYGQGTPIAPLQVSFRFMYDLEYKSPKSRST